MEQLFLLLIHIVQVIFLEELVVLEPILVILMMILEEVELELDGKDPAEAFPLIRYHLELCTGCSEEYEALLAALNQLQADSPADSAS